jgi:hypothetical protein
MRPNSAPRASCVAAVGWVLDWEGGHYNWLPPLALQSPHPQRAESSQKKQSTRAFYPNTPKKVKEGT